MIDVQITSAPRANSTFMAPITQLRNGTGICFGPVSSSGELFPAVKLSQRSSLDKKPEHVGPKFILGDKPVSHTQVVASVVGNPTNVASLVRRKQNGTFLSSDIQSSGWRLDNFREVYDITIWEKISPTEVQSLTVSTTRQNHNLQLRNVSLNTRILTSESTYAYTKDGYVLAYISTEKAKASPDSAWTQLTDQEFAEIRSRGIQATLDYLQSVGISLRGEETSQRVARTAYFITFQASEEPTTRRAADIVRLVNSVAYTASQLRFDTQRKPLSDLIGDAAASADSNAANMIAFVRDLKDVKSLVPKLKNLGSIRTHANNYLAVNYGILPTVGDLNAIHEALNKSHWTDSFGNQVLTSGHQSSAVNGFVTKTLIQRAKLVVSNEDENFSSLVRQLRSSGFYPSPQNLWDLIPYSFVLDWFVDIGGVLERWDSGVRIAQLPIVLCTLSEKSIIDFSELLADLLPGYTCSATITTYNRTVHDKPPESSFTFNSEFTADRHLVEGGALILSRKRK